MLSIYMEHPKILTISYLNCSKWILISKIIKVKRNLKRKKEVVTAVEVKLIEIRQNMIIDPGIP